MALKYQIGIKMDAKAKKEQLAYGRGRPTIELADDVALPKLLEHLSLHPSDTFAQSITADRISSGGLPALVEALDAFDRVSQSDVTFTGSPVGIGASIMLARKDSEQQELLKPRSSEIQAAGYQSNKIGVREHRNRIRVGHNNIWWSIYNASRNRFIEPGDLKLDVVDLPQHILPLKEREHVHISAIVGQTPELSELPPSMNLGTSLRDVGVGDSFDFSQKMMALIGAHPRTLNSNFMGTSYTKRFWNNQVKVNFGGADYESVAQTSNDGKGMTLETSRNGANWETIERFCSTMGVRAVTTSGEDWPRGFEDDYDSNLQDMGIRKASAAQLKAEKLTYIDPNAFVPTTEYKSDEEIYWVIGRDPSGAKKYLPLQAVYSLANLDEPEIITASSNGLTAGNQPDDSILHGLDEIVERQGDWTMFFKKDRCFTLEPGQGKLKDICDTFQEKGVKLQFQDLTTEMGVPVYRAYARVNNQIISGSGASLNGEIALTRAVCELNAKVFGRVLSDGSIDEGEIDIDKFEFGPQKIDSDNVRTLDGIPNYSTGNVSGDRKRMEMLFQQNGHDLVYVNFRRKDLTLEGKKAYVYRVVVPGMDYPQGVPEDLVRHFMQDAKLDITDSKELTDEQVWLYASHRKYLQNAAGIPAGGFKRLGEALHEKPIPETFLHSTQAMSRDFGKGTSQQMGYSMAVSDGIEHLRRAICQSREKYWEDQEDEPEKKQLPPKGLNLSRKKKKKKKK